MSSLDQHVIEENRSWWGKGNEYLKQKSVDYILCLFTKTVPLYCTWGMLHKQTAKLHRTCD